MAGTGVQGAPMSCEYKVLQCRAAFDENFVVVRILQCYAVQYVDELKQMLVASPDLLSRKIWHKIKV